jgi:hypothetical protein
MSDDKEEGRVGPDPNVNKDEFIKASINALSRLVDRAMQGDTEALENLQTIADVLTSAFKRSAPVAVQRALELRELKWSLAQVVKPSPSSSNKKGSVFHGSIVINEKREGHPLYAEAKMWADSRMTLKSLSRRVFNARLEQEGRQTLEKSQFDADEQQLKRWEKEQRQNKPSYLHYAPPPPQNIDDLKEHSRKMFSKERYDPLEDTEAVYAVEQTWKKRKTDRRRDKD